MRHGSFDDTAVEEPSPGWRRRGLVGADDVSVDWFEKPAGHVSEPHAHPETQAFVVLEGALRLHAEADSALLGPLDTAVVEGGERHHSENPGDEPCTGLNVFAPGREFPYWTDGVSSTE